MLPVLVLVRFIGWRRRRAKLRKFGDPELLKALMPNVSSYRPTVKFGLLLAALALLILMVARPQMGSKISHDKRQGIETIICLAISNSMWQRMWLLRDSTRARCWWRTWSTSSPTTR